MDQETGAGAVISDFVSCDHWSELTSPGFGLMDGCEHRT